MRLSHQFPGAASIVGRPLQRQQYLDLPEFVDSGGGEVLPHGPLQDLGPTSQPHGQLLGGDVQRRVLGAPERDDLVDLVERMIVVHGVTVLS